MGTRTKSGLDTFRGQLLTNTLTTTIAKSARKLVFGTLCKVFWTVPKTCWVRFHSVGGMQILRYYFLPFGLGIQKNGLQNFLFSIHFVNLFSFLILGHRENEFLGTFESDS